MLPNLRIVPVSSLIVHETVDPMRIARLKKRFQGGSKLNNPPLVAPLGRGKYVVLDGANRVTVARQLKFLHLLVQIVDYRVPAVALHIWNHVIEGVAWNTWWAKVERVAQGKIVTMTLARARQLLMQRKLCAYIVSQKGQCYGIKVLQTERDRLRLWNAIVETYKGRYTLHRTIESDMDAVRDLYPRSTALVVFPSLQKRDILHFAKNGLKIPSGISRHVIPGRALHVDVPFSLLRARKSVASKNAWLKRHVAILSQSNRIRYYSEPVYLYDE
jgi:hypothetical protein